MREWGVAPREFKVVVLDNGLGDHFIFKSILPDLVSRNPGKLIIVANCFPDVLKDVAGITMASIADARAAFGNLEQWNIYRWCDDRGWRRGLSDAFREMYL